MKLLSGKSEVRDASRTFLRALRGIASTVLRQVGDDLRRIGNRDYFRRFPVSTRVLAARFEQAIERIPERDAPRLRMHWPAVYESLVLESQRCGRSIYQLSEQLTALASGFHHVQAAGTRGVPEPGRSLEVLFVTGMFPAIESGGGLRVFDMINALARRGHRMSLYSPGEQDRRARSLALLEGSLTHHESVGASRIVPGDFQLWLEQSGKRFDAIHYVWSGAEVIEAGRPFTTNSVVELIESLTRRSLMDLELALAAGDAVALARAIVTFIDNWQTEQRSIAAADHVVTVTAVDAEFTSRVFGLERVEVVPTGLSPIVLGQRSAAVVAGAPLHHESAIFLGNYDHRPNKDAVRWFLHNVHPKVLEVLPSFRFIVAGAGELSELKREFRNLASVEFLGEVQDLVPTLQSSRICVAPLVSGAGGRLKINQYSAASRPTVSTSIGVSGSPYEHGKSILIADAPGEFATQIVRLLTDADLYNRVRDSASEVALKHFSWAPFIRDLEAIYRGGSGSAHEGVAH